MSTNYYLVKSPCPTCGHGEQEHVAGYTMGWRVLFQATTEVRSFAQWKERIAAPDVALRDESGETVTLAEFVALVDAAQGWKSAVSGMSPFEDAEGYEFTEYDFS